MFAGDTVEVCGGDVARCGGQLAGEGGGGGHRGQQGQGGHHGAGRAETEPVARCVGCRNSYINAVVMNTFAEKCLNFYSILFLNACC